MLNLFFGIQSLLEPLIKLRQAKSFDKIQLLDKKRIIFMLLRLIKIKNKNLNNGLKIIKFLFLYKWLYSKIKNIFTLFFLKKKN